MCVPLEDIPSELRNDIEEMPNITVHQIDNETSFCGDAGLFLKRVSELVISSLNFINLKGARNLPYITHKFLLDFLQWYCFLTIFMFFVHNGIYVIVEIRMIDSEGVIGYIQVKDLHDLTAH